MSRPQVLITGASRGIGLEISKKFHSEQFRLHLVAQNRERLTDVVQNYFPGAMMSPVNLSDEDLVNQWLDSIGDPPDVLVLNAGYALNKPFLETDSSERRTEFQVNFFTNVQIIKKMLPKMKPGSAIITIGSLTALLPFPGDIHYAASKAALYSFMQSLAIEEKDRKIHFGQVLPGFVKTDMTAHVDSVLPFHSASEVAESTWSCYKNKSKIVIPGIINQANAFLARSFPSLFSTMLEIGIKYLPFPIIPENRK